jgi:hypothetical protein
MAVAYEDYRTIVSVMADDVGTLRRKGGRLLTTLDRPPAFDWFSRVAEELELLDTGMKSWRTRAAVRLRTIAADNSEMEREDAELLALIAAELLGEEDEGALDLGLVTWRTLAADEIRALGAKLAAVLPGQLRLSGRQTASSWITGAADS